MTTIRTALLCVFLFAIATRRCCAKEGPPPILNPKTYVSQTGACSLLVDPTDLHGRGAAECRFTKNGKPLWTRRFAFTLWDAVVADNGSIAGYAYTHGWRGYAAEGIRAGTGEFVVVLLSAEGKLLNQETHAREHSRFLDFPPNPLATGIVLDQHGNRFLVRVGDPDVNRHIEQWWVFDLSTGKRTGVLEPGKLMPRGDSPLSILDAQAVPGTPLVLTHWWKSVYPPRYGALFTLVDPQGKPAWSLSLDDDYTVPGDESAEDRIREMIWSKGAILSVDKSPAFAIHLVKERKRVSFAVAKAANGSWQVRETARTPYQPDQPTPKPVEYRELKPDKVGVVRLDGTGAEKDARILNVEGFDFDPKGRICALLSPRDKAPRLVLVSQRGDILHDIPLPVEKIPEVARFSNPANVGGSRFVVTMSGREVGSIAECFLADFDSVFFKRLPEFACPTVEALAGFGDGRFAALTDCREKYTSTKGLYFFDPRGKCLWKKEEGGYGGSPEDFLSPEDIARCGADTIAVLDNIRHTVQLLDVRGRFLRTIDLDKTWGRKTSYPIHVAEDSEGGFLVYDFLAKNPLVRMDAKGRIRSESVPRFADGRPFRVVGSVKRSPQGELWTSDGDSLLRLAANGTVDQILGEGPALRRLTQPDHCAVDAKDRIYVADRRTKAVHVFDATGKRLGVCVPDAKDLSEISYVRHIAVAPAGEVFVLLSSKGSDSPYIRFGSDLSRKGTAQVDVDSVSQDWYFQPSGDLCWIKAYNDVFLVKGLRETVRTVSRRADRRWLEYPAGLAVAPDASIAVLARNQSGDTSVSTYGPTGDARSTFPVPEEWWYCELAYDGQSIFIRHETNVFVVPSTGRNLGRFSLGSETTANDWNGPFLAAKGRQLWFFDRKRMALHKYSIPTSFSRPVL